MITFQSFGSRGKDRRVMTFMVIDTTIHKGYRISASAMEEEGKYYCCGATVGSKQQHNHDLRETRIAERRFLTGLPRGYFVWGKGAAITDTQATIKPRRRPLRETESHVRLKHKLIQNIVPFWKTFVTKKRVPFLSGGCIITFKFHHYE